MEATTTESTSEDVEAPQETLSFPAWRGRNFREETKWDNGTSRAVHVGWKAMAQGGPVFLEWELRTLYVEYLRYRTGISGG